ncbi:MAG: hypothetical protein J6C33_10215 [Lachnospiraceae bacterium]|nr:hypothetical protein [Lachnospiraceae bacterium]
MAAMGAKRSGIFGNRNTSQVSDSTRGADSSELTGVKVNNEVAFCKVYNVKRKEEIERLLLKNRISYFVKWQEQGVLKRMFSSDSKESVIFIICIHDTAVAQAKELVADMQDIKVLVP